MKTRLNPRWLLISTLLFSLQFCRAQVVVLPSTLSYGFGTSNATASQLWDLNGDYVAELLVERGGVSMPVEVGFSLIQSPKGQLSSSVGDLPNATVVFNNDNDSAFAAFAKISGKVTGSGGLARVQFTVHFTGSGALAKTATDINGTLSVNAEVDSTTEGQLSGSSKFSAHFSKVSNSVGGKSDFAANLPPGADGSWNLTMHLVGLNKVTGVGVINTRSEPLGLNLGGKFKNGLFVIKGTGASNVPDALSGVGSSLTVLIPATFDSVQFSGKVMGQKLSFP